MSSKLQETLDKIQVLMQEASGELEQVDSMKVLNALRVKYTGKKGVIADLAKVMRDLDNDGRRELGQYMNEFKKKIE